MRPNSLSAEGLSVSGAGGLGGFLYQGAGGLMGFMYHGPSVSGAVGLVLRVVAR